MTTTTQSNPVVAPADDDGPPPTPAEKRPWLIPVVVGVVAFGAGVGVGSKLSWRFSAWWRPT